ncbi:MAG: ATP-binding protein, partial [Candidatus Omnitrophota bacterium]
IRKLSLYPSKHPTAVYSVKTLYTKLQEILNKREALNIGLSSDNQILIEGQLIGEMGTKLMEGLANYFKKLNIESLTLKSGVTEEELEAFIRIILMEPEEIKKLGELSKVFLENNIQHIKTAQFSYVKIEKGKKALQVEEGKLKLLEELKLKIKDFSQGKIEKPEDIEHLEKDVFNMVTAEFKQQGKLSSKTKNILKKFILGSQERQAVFTSLNNALLAAGLPQDEADKLVDKVKQEISKKLTPKLGVAGLDKEELVRLKTENEKLKTKINQLQQEIDAKAASLEKLSKESKRITQEKERIDNIVHHMAEGVVVVDPKGKVVMLNPVAEKLLDLGKDAVGVPLSKTIKDEHLLTVVKNIAPDKDGALQKDIEVLSQDDSTKRVLRTSSAVVEDPNGKTVGMVTVLNDVTRQREIEKMKSDFVSNVSHELRTPMATIQQNISLLMEGLPGVLNDSQTKFLNIAQDNIKRLKRLINDLLDTAAIESGKFKLRISPAKINERIDNVVIFLKKWAESKKISIQMQLLPNDEVLEIDKDRIEQVLTNLISNAVKFTPEGGEVFVSALKREPMDEFPQGAIEISVKDTGPGIAPENIKKVFERFERAGAATSNVGGTGLGLSICQQIVAMHSGKIWVESKLKQGSKFSFLLPIKSS